MCYLNRRRAIRDRNHGVDGASGPSRQCVYGAIVGSSLWLVFRKFLVPVD